MTKPPLHPDQAKALSLISSWLTSETFGQWFLLSGSAGMGKTYLLAHLPESFRGRTIFTAPTNKAVQALKSRISSPSYSPEFCTIYSLLRLTLQPSGEVRVLTAPENPPDIFRYSLIVIDEASMISSKLIPHLLRAVSQYGVKVLLIGDPKQLPPVGEPSSPIWSLPIPTLARFSLSKVLRHDNDILRIATHVREASEFTFPVFQPKSHYTPQPSSISEGVHLLSGKAFSSQILSSLPSLLAPGKAKVIAWRNVTVDKWNSLIRGALWGKEASKPFLPGDRVVFTAPARDPTLDTLDASTDDEGIINSFSVSAHPSFPAFTVFRLSITLDSNRTLSSFVLHPSSGQAYLIELERLSAAARATPRKWKDFWKFKDSFHSLRHAYAITAHRSQGSTYETAFVCYPDILLNQDRSEAFKCLYVAVSRPSKFLYLGA